MYTQCPECGTVFRVTATVLRAAQARVRCGVCDATFNALQFLTDDLAGDGGAVATDDPAQDAALLHAPATAPADERLEFNVPPADWERIFIAPDRDETAPGPEPAAAEQASVNVQTVASATEELSASIGEISRQVTESTRIASGAVEEANRTNGTVAGLQEAAQKIGEVVQLINNIASQTNLLALNATIEAARAGDAGKGFAVVASEVKNLANQTAKATEDIQNQVGQMQSVTGHTVEAIRSITGTITRMSEIATAIASAVEEQGAATQEISRNVQEASRGTAEVSGSIQGVVAIARDTGGGAGETLAAANSLGTAAENLSVEVDRFIGTIRRG